MDTKETGHCVSVAGASGKKIRSFGSQGLTRGLFHRVAEATF